MLKFFRNISLLSNIQSEEKLKSIYVDKSSKFIKIYDTNIHYKDEGFIDSDKVFILLHGLGGAVHNWDELSVLLSQNHRVIRLDLPGFGLSDTPPTPPFNMSMEKMLFYIREFITLLHIKQKPIMVGNSLGGWITWEYAIKFPDALSSIILLNPAGYNMKRVLIPLKILSKKGVLKTITKTGIPYKITKILIQRQFYDVHKVPTHFYRTTYQLINQQRKIEFCIQLAEQPIVNNLAHLKNILIPTLIIWGNSDTTLPVDQAYFFHTSIPGSKLIIYDKAGHVPMIEIPEEVYRDVLEFLKHTNCES